MFPKTLRFFWRVGGLEEIILLFQIILEINFFLNVFVIYDVFWKKKNNFMKPHLK